MLELAEEACQRQNLVIKCFITLTPGDKISFSVCSEGSTINLFPAVFKSATYRYKLECFSVTFVSTQLNICGQARSLALELSSVRYPKRVGSGLVCNIGLKLPSVSRTRRVLRYSFNYNHKKVLK
jgi:hypothetical protein